MFYAVSGAVLQRKDCHFTRSSAWTALCISVYIRPVFRSVGTEMSPVVSIFRQDSSLVGNLSKSYALFFTVLLKLDKLRK
jgi:hypothetical protein